MKNHYEILQECLLVFCILNYKYHEQLLYTFHYNHNDLWLYDIFILTISTKSFFRIYSILFAYYVAFFLYLLMVSFLFFHSLLFLLHALLNSYKTFSYSLYIYNNQAYFCCIKWRLCNQWIIWRCMFIYFGCWWFFRIMASANFLKQRF